MKLNHTIDEFLNIFAGNLFRDLKLCSNHGYKLFCISGFLTGFPDKSTRFINSVQLSGQRIEQSVLAFLDEIEQDHGVLFDFHSVTTTFKTFSVKKVSVKEVIEMWESIKEGVLEYLKGTEVLSIIAHGSFVEGFANKTSDFDLLIVCRDDTRERTEVIMVHDKEVDMDFFRESTLRNQLKSINDVLKPGFQPPFVMRLKNAVILLDREDTGKMLVATAQEFSPSHQVMTRYSKMGLSYYYDAVGAMTSGDYATSMHMARLGALEVLTGIMLKQRELYIQKKWLIKLMDRNPAPTELFLRLMGLDAADKEKAQQCIRDLNSLIEEFEHLKEQET